jgi:uncharacterized protein (TIGR03083 family)
MDRDYRSLIWDEVVDIGDLLYDLRDEEWDEPSLCEGWRVRDVVGHMAFGHTTRFPKVVVLVVRYRGNIERASFELSRRFASTHTPAELAAFWDLELVQKHASRGIARTIADHEAFVDHVVHHQDMRRPLGRPRQIPEARLVAVLEALPMIDSKLFDTRSKLDGVRVSATDVEWRHGDGPTIEGPGEAIVMAVAGRTVALDDLEGDGVAVLAERIGAAATSSN